MKKSKLFAVVAAIAMTASLAVTIPARAAGIEMTYLTPAYLKGTVASTERIVADWNKANPNATVKIVYGDVNNMQDKLTTAFAGNVAPDILQHEAASILEFSKQGQRLHLHERCWIYLSKNAQLFHLRIQLRSQVHFHLST